MEKVEFKNKPGNWFRLPLYKKIGYTMRRLDERYAPYVDKLQAKEIVLKMCGDKIKVPKTIKVLKNPDDLELKDLNEKYILKASHSSGRNYSMKKEVSTPRLRALINFVKKNYKKYDSPGENQYQYLEPKFFIEEKIEDRQFGRTGNAITYMLRCIHSIPYTITILDKGKNMQKHYMFNKDKTIKEIVMDYASLEQKEFNYKLDMLPQSIINRMWELASILSKPFDFVRVDFYVDKKDDIYFSEFTFSPGHSHQSFNMETEVLLGKLWT